MTTENFSPLVSSFDNSEESILLIRRLLTRLPLYVDELESSTAESDQFLEVVHKIKGVFGSYGFTAVSDYAAELMQKRVLSQADIRVAVERFKVFFSRMEASYPFFKDDRKGKYDNGGSSQQHLNF